MNSLLLFDLARSHCSLCSGQLEVGSCAGIGIHVLYELLLVFAAGVDGWGLLLVLFGGHGEPGAAEEGAEGSH